jgi:hypothetical protein
MRLDEKMVCHPDETEQEGLESEVPVLQQLKAEPAEPKKQAAP